ncbi:DUF1501 domain-containing protein [Akkermansiaceae bacterium]|nr:DUF1501 domain-containing protein [Akkermansiaceae bacterium]MDB4467388.1 DUF1501 domain-containing protein [Akkermansiaceae bacterium]MDB4570249.1 DUF1501 domain-containing protein [Akkermansiaceae bacterium]MDB4644167.1 DUF1501 domain-containing protein [bacterium]
MKKVSRKIGRRVFLGEASCGTVGSVSALSSLLSLRLTGLLSAEEGDSTEDYKALVCVFLAGGNDSFNMLSPVDQGGYSEYATARGAVALGLDQFNTLNTSASDGRMLGLHSAMEEIHSLYSDGNAAFVANVGTLIEPTTMAGITAESVKLPLGLYSHSDQQLHWQSNMPETRSPGSGWGGRMADLLNDLNAVSGVSMNMSLAGKNLFQVGESTSVFTKTPGSIPGISNWNNPLEVQRRDAITSVIEAEYQNIFKRTLMNQTKGAIASSEEYRIAIEDTAPLTATFDPNNQLSLQLKDVAETIAARENLGKKRQTFFVQIGGWDQHSSLETHPEMLAALSKGIGEFQAAMGELGVSDQVTLFTASDFGRTLSPNGGGGSDHAWGGNQIVVGGAVDGGKVYGDYPSLALGDLLDTGRGRLIPTTAVDEYVAEMALWMGVSRSDLPQVLPNIGRFWSTWSQGLPLGIMA